MTEHSGANGEERGRDGGIEGVVGGAKP